MRADRLRLLDAVEQVDLVRCFAEQGKDIFFNDILVQSAILHRLALLGEACRGLSPEIRDNHPEIPWAQIVAFRNVLIHEYFGVDLELVWAIVAGHVTAIGSSLQAILDSLPE